MTSGKTVGGEDYYELTPDEMQLGDNANITAESATMFNGEPRTVFCRAFNPNFTTKFVLYDRQTWQHDHLLFEGLREHPDRIPRVGDFVIMEGEKKPRALLQIMPGGGFRLSPKLEPRSHQQWQLDNADKIGERWRQDRLAAERAKAKQETSDLDRQITLQKLKDDALIARARQKANDDLIAMQFEKMRALPGTFTAAFNSTGVSASEFERGLRALEQAMAGKKISRSDIRLPQAEKTEPEQPKRQRAISLDDEA
jgi:hypothetical protein